jgi:hypothetical protein
MSGMGITWVPGFRYSKPCTLSDTVENAKNATGLHNASTTTAALVHLFYMDDHEDTITIGPGVYLLCTPKRIMLTGTTVGAATDIHSLWG